MVDFTKDWIVGLTRDNRKVAFNMLRAGTVQQINDDFSIVTVDGEKWEVCGSFNEVFEAVGQAKPQWPKRRPP